MFWRRRRDGNSIPLRAFLQPLVRLSQGFREVLLEPLHHGPFQKLDPHKIESGSDSVNHDTRTRAYGEDRCRAQGVRPCQMRPQPGAHDGVVVDEVDAERPFRRGVHPADGRHLPGGEQGHLLLLHGAAGGL